MSYRERQSQSYNSEHLQLFMKHIPWRRKWQPTPVCSPGKSHGQRSLGATVHEIPKSWTQLSNYTATMKYILLYLSQSLSTAQLQVDQYTTELVHGYKLHYITRIFIDNSQNWKKKYLFLLQDYQPSSHDHVRQQPWLN